MKPLNSISKFKILMHDIPNESYPEYPCEYVRGDSSSSPHYVTHLSNLFSRIILSEKGFTFFLNIEHFSISFQFIMTRRIHYQKEFISTRRNVSFIYFLSSARICKNEFIFLLLGNWNLFIFNSYKTRNKFSFCNDNRKTYRSRLKFCAGGIIVKAIDFRYINFLFLHCEKLLSITMSAVIVFRIYVHRNERLDSLRFLSCCYSSWDELFSNFTNFKVRTLPPSVQGSFTILGSVDFIYLLYNCSSCLFFWIISIK